ncbi:unnamed protein product, partial [Callosobruchus maculatus]
SFATRRDDHGPRPRTASTSSLSLPPDGRTLELPWRPDDHVLRKRTTRSAFQLCRGRSCEVIWFLLVG